MPKPITRQLSPRLRILPCSLNWPSFEPGVCECQVGGEGGGGAHVSLHVLTGWLSTPRAYVQLVCLGTLIIG
jgi:hypothetical protein